VIVAHQHRQGGGLMATFQEQQARTVGFRSWSRGRWLVVGGLVAAIVIALVLILIYTGAGSGGRGGY